jgi:hypothetical protein
MGLRACGALLPRRDEQEMDANRGSARFPSGAARECGFATVTAVADASKLEQPYDAGHRKSMRETGVGPLRTPLRPDVLSPFASAEAMEPA